MMELIDFTTGTYLVRVQGDLNNLAKTVKLF